MHFPLLPHSLFIPYMTWLSSYVQPFFFKSYFSPLYFSFGAVWWAKSISSCYLHSSGSIWCVVLDIPHYSFKVNLSTQLIWWFPLFPSPLCGYFCKNKAFEHTSELPVSLSLWHVFQFCLCQSRHVHLWVACYFAPFIYLECWSFYILLFAYQRFHTPVINTFTKRCVIL